MTYQAIYSPKGGGFLPRKVLEEPAIRRYYADFGREGDLAFVALSDGEAVGAVWIRFATTEQKGYGFVRADVPELMLAVLPAFRGARHREGAAGADADASAGNGFGGCLLECGPLQSSGQPLWALRIPNRENATKLLHNVAEFNMTIQ